MRLGYLKKIKTKRRISSDIELISNENNKMEMNNNNKCTQFSVCTRNMDPPNDVRVDNSDHSGSYYDYACFLHFYVFLTTVVRYFFRDKLMCMCGVIRVVLYN